MFKWLRSILGNCRGTDVVEINDTTTSNLDYAIPEMWDTKIRLDAIKTAFWGSRFEGKQGSKAPLIVNTDFSKGPGDVIHFQTMKRLKGAGVTGETVLTGSEETLSLGQFDLTVDWVRHAVGFNKRGTKRANFDAVGVAGDELADWLARYIDDSIFNEIINNSEGSDTIYSGGKVSEAGLDSSAVFNTASLDKMKVALLRKGSIPFQTKTSGGANLKYFGVVIDPIDAYNLRGDDAWYAAQRDAQGRGDDNPIFTGALGIYNGMIIYEFGNVAGQMGTWLRPEAKLSAALSAAGTTATVTIDSTVALNATKYFPETGTVRIDNEEMTYSAKTVNTLTVDGRGANGTSGATHASGALVTLRNISTQVGFGAEIAVRGWGLYPQATKDVQDYGFRFGVGIEAVFGQQVVCDSYSKVPNLILMKSYAANPNAGI